MKKLMNVLMLSCKKASELIDKKSVTKLSFKQSVMLRMHTGMCDICAQYQKQSKVLDHLLHTHAEKQDDAIDLVENRELKEKIISNL